LKLHTITRSGRKAGLLYGYLISARRGLKELIHAIFTRQSLALETGAGI
jgi:hypothetical protein